MAGWTYRSEDHHSFLRSPDYTHGSACRGETLSRFDFHLVLEREGWKTVEQVLVPCTVFRSKATLLLLLPLLRSKRYGKHYTSTHPCGPWRHGRLCLMVKTKASGVAQAPRSGRARAPWPHNT